MVASTVPTPVPNLIEQLVGGFNSLVWVGSIKAKLIETTTQSSVLYTELVVGPASAHETLRHASALFCCCMLVKRYSTGLKSQATAKVGQFKPLPRKL